jgi:hypothetical protein
LNNQSGNTDKFDYLCRMQEKKTITFKTPDITKMQEVVINHRTKIYIAVDADPEEARSRYWARQDAKGKVLIPVKKPALT